MRGKLPLTILTAMILLVTAGCIETDSPFGSRPTLLVDYIPEVNESLLLVKGVGDHLYSNISIQINDGPPTVRNYTYMLEVHTMLTSFTTNITVWDDDDQYFYSLNLTFHPEKDQIEYMDSDHSDPVKRDLPFNKLLERIEND